MKQLLPYLPLLLAFTLAFVIVYLVIPIVIKVAKLKKLYDQPDGKRKLNSTVVPTLGGKAIFIGYLVSVILCSYNYEFKELRYITASLIVLLYIGLKDDILYLSPKNKLIGQLFAALILVVMADIRFISLHGVFGIGELNYWVSIIFSLIVIVFITNSLNLIDGIDGLCSLVGSIASLIFTLLFSLNGDFEMALLSISLAGSLIAFFPYNVFGNNNKIFLGDTGSLLVGMVLSILFIKLNTISLQDHVSLFKVINPMNIAIAILIIPLVDTTRVFILRFIKGNSPWSADNMHTHHQILQLGLSHLRTTLTYVVISLVFITLTVFFQYHYSATWLLLFQGVLVIILVNIPPLLLRRGYGKTIDSKNNKIKELLNKVVDRTETNPDKNT